MRMVLSNAELLAMNPVNAWLMIGDDASYPTVQELRTMRRRRFPREPWTAPPQAQPGDLLLFYFLAPRKQIRYAARAGVYPFFDSTMGVNAVRDIDPHQWWTTHTPLIETPPISFGDLAAAMGGHLVLRGKPRHYLDPAVVRRLISVMTNRAPVSSLGPELAQVLKVPSGDPDLPNPARVRLPGWSRMASGPLRLEAQVEQYVVEPLLRMALQRQGGVSWKRQHRVVGGGVADYVITQSGLPTGVVEVKVAVAEPSGGRWGTSPEFTQISGYVKQLRVPGLLIDCQRIFFVEPGAKSPSRIVNRVSATAADLVDIGHHLTR